MTDFSSSSSSTSMFFFSYKNYFTSLKSLQVAQREQKNPNENKWSCRFGDEIFIACPSNFTLEALLALAKQIKNFTLVPWQYFLAFSKMKRKGRRDVKAPICSFRRWWSWRFFLTFWKLLLPTNWNICPSTTLNHVGIFMEWGSKQQSEWELNYQR